MINQAYKYYKRFEILEFIYEYTQGREVAIFNKQGKIITKRPWTIENEGDVLVKAKEGGIGIHATTEIWEDPYRLEDLNTKKYYENLREFDIVLDFDLKLYDSDVKNFILSRMIVEKFLEYLDALGLKDTYYVKFSGNKGFHIVIPHKNIPTEINGLDVRKYKEEVYRAVLIFFDRILRIAISDIEKRYNITILERLKDNIIDFHLASWRHMIRIPYSLHEKTGLVSVIIDRDKVSKFKREEANPSLIMEDDIIRIDTSDKKIEDLILLSLGYTYFHELSRKSGRKAIKYIRKVPEDELPPCVKALLEGVPVGIRNNTMFFLINFFRLLGYKKEQVEQMIKEWNEKNSEPLREREVEYAIEYHFSRNKYSPYSCEKFREYIGRTYCQPNEICQYIKHPLQYVRLVRKLRKRKNVEKKQ